MKRVMKVMISVMTVFFFLASILLLVIGTMSLQENRYIKIFNYSYSVVGSGSMEPTIMTGEFIIIKYIDYDDVYSDVEAGSKPIIAFRTDKNIVHRAIEATEEGLVTKGDNNSAIDAGYVTEENFIGIVVANFMLLDIGNITLNYKNLVFLVIIIILLFILVHEMVNFIKMVRHAQEEKMLAEHELTKDEWIKAEKERIRLELEAEMKARREAENDKNSTVK
ncbi:signal peptidase I [Acholeplasma vituli]|uniref:Signal peptidase I n=1 Tax=Paracholeplasma vituli TaxID=69473 RepID=A0ABT2PW58_9MOLU|nr:signal peptidase I [Paracholeplasma vituli]MCU0105080.1 signal peptidase I [Paracholeplasma vituli]